MVGNAMSEIISIKKIKKDGSIDLDITKKIVELLREDKVLILPIDGIYGFLAVDNDTTRKKMKKLPVDSENFVHLVSSYSMLDKLTVLTKRQFDFLHRIWPDEVDVILPTSESVKNEYMQIRFPRYKFIRDILAKIKEPLIFYNTKKRSGKQYFKRSELRVKFKDFVDALIIIDEWCKSHPESTLIDLRGDELKFLRKGRVSVDEIKSLYFLDAFKDF